MTGSCNEVALVNHTLNTKCGRIVGARKLPADFSVGGFSVADFSEIFQMPKMLPVDFFGAEKSSGNFFDA